MNSTLYRSILYLCALTFIIGCEDDFGAGPRKAIREIHVPEVTEMLREDRAKHLRGIRTAATAIAPKYRFQDPEQRERVIRAKLKKLQEPPRGVSEFISSGMTFLAALDAEGVVIARDADPDAMKGDNLAERFPEVRRVLTEGTTEWFVGAFPAAEEGGEESVDVMFAAPVIDGGQRVGALVGGIGLWAVARRVSTQLRLNHSAEIPKGLIIRAYTVHNGRIYKPDLVPELDDNLPPVSTFEEALASNPKGHSGALQLFSRWHAWGIVPIRHMPGVSVVIVRANPIKD